MGQKKERKEMMRGPFAIKYIGVTSLLDPVKGEASLSEVIVAAKYERVRDCERQWGEQVGEGDL